MFCWFSNFNWLFNMIYCPHFYLQKTFEDNSWTSAGVSNFRPRPLPTSRISDSLKGSKKNVKNDTGRIPRLLKLKLHSRVAFKLIWLTHFIILCNLLKVDYFSFYPYHFKILNFITLTHFFFPAIIYRQSCIIWF